MKSQGRTVVELGSVIVRASDYKYACESAASRVALSFEWKNDVSWQQSCTDPLATGRNI
jgi:hypothetical protein